MANNIGDLGFNGSGSRFNSRFGAGEPILAKQLNDLASGVQTGLPMPYLGEGPSISFTSGGTIITPLDTAQTTLETPKPFTINVTKVGSEYRFTAIAGTINGLVPCIGGSTGASKLLTANSPVPYGVLTFNGDGNCWVYLKSGVKPSGTKIWPDNDFTQITYPNVIGFNAIQTDSDEYGHILVALVNKNPDTDAITVNNLLQTSVWSQRNKYTLPDSAIYYFWPI
jgi:hypothetical protein